MDLTLIFDKTHGNRDVYMDVLNSLVGTKRESFLDIGCNHAPHTCQLNFKKRKYIDILPRELDNKDEQEYFEQRDAIDFLKECNEKYDVIFSLDQIEHVTIEYGVEQTILMQKVSNKQIYFTPLNEWMMTTDEDNNPESHRSLWTPLDIPDFKIKIIFPEYHEKLGIGAWFWMDCNNMNEEFERIKNELKEKSWYHE